MKFNEISESESGKLSESPRAPWLNSTRQEELRAFYIKNTVYTYVNHNNHKENLTMKKESRERIKNLFEQIFEELNNQPVGWWGYVRLMVRKLYRIMGYGRNRNVQAVEEWMELLAFCEMMAQIDYVGLLGDNEHSDFQDWQLRKLNHFCDKLRDGVAREWANLDLDELSEPEEDEDELKENIEE